MKKFWLSLGLTLMLACWCGSGYYGFGTGAAFGQQNYYSRSLSCNPSDPSCYNDYYRAPYADPLSQLLYYVAPPVDQDRRYETRQSYQYQETKKERKDREKRDKRDRKNRDRDRQGY